jgi:hypothetical protein
MRTRTYGCEQASSRAAEAGPDNVHVNDVGPEPTGLGM